MRQRQQLPDYRDSLPNLAQSILREFGITEVGRESLKSLDPYLGKGYPKYRCPFTGWDRGQKLWREVWRGMDSFSDAKKADYHSVFPPTTDCGHHIDPEWASAV